MLDELERLHKAATPGEWGIDRDGEIFPLAADGSHDIQGEVAAMVSDNPADGPLIVAARNALPALLRVARAALRYADLDGLPCDYAELDPDLDWQDRKAPCPGIEKNGVPCHWCDLRAALAALTTTTAPPASDQH